MRIMTYLLICFSIIIIAFALLLSKRALPATILFKVAFMLVNLVWVLLAFFFYLGSRETWDKLDTWSYWCERAAFATTGSILLYLFSQSIFLATRKAIGKKLRNRIMVTEAIIYVIVLLCFIGLATINLLGRSYQVPQ